MLSNKRLSICLIYDKRLTNMFLFLPGFAMVKDWTWKAPVFYHGQPRCKKNILSSLFILQINDHSKMLHIVWKPDIFVERQNTKSYSKREAQHQPIFFRKLKKSSLSMTLIALQLDDLMEIPLCEQWGHQKFVHKMFVCLIVRSVWYS